MQEPTEHLRALATRIVEETLKRIPLRAALLTGSAALEGVRTEVSFVALAWFDSRLDELVTEIEKFDSSLQKVLSGLLEGLALYGEELLERRRARVRTYPEPLRQAIVERHWNVFPLWHYRDAMAARDAELWRLEMLLEAAFNLLAVLAA